MRKFRLVAALGRQPTQQQQQQREVGVIANGNGVSVANGPETAASLLAAGLDARAAELASATPLQRAAAEGHVDIVHQLLKHGADVNHQDSLHGNSALHEAAWRGYSQTATILCRQRAKVDAVNRAGFTPLHLCCQNGHNETCRVLLWADANPDAKNHYGDTPLHTSGRYGHAGVMRILVSAQCNVSEQNKNGDTALHIAAAMGRRKLTRILIAAGCSTNVKNKQGEYAVDIARRKEFHEIVSMLVKSPPKASANGGSRGTHAHDRSKSSSTKSKSKRVKPDSATASSKDGSRSNSSKPKERKRRKEKHGSAGEKTLNGHVVNSPYGCHDNPELAKLLHKKLNALPDEPLKQGEQYFLDLAGNIQKGPVGVPTCYCGPVLHRLECRLAKDKQEILHRLDSAHLRLDAKIDGLERKTQQQLQGLQRTVDSLGLESSAAGLQRVRNSIVIDDPGHSTPPLPNCLELVSDSATSHSHRDSDDPAQPSQRTHQKRGAKAKPVEADQVQQPQQTGNEVQYTMDRLGLDSGVQESSSNKQQALQALKNRLALTRIQEQLELDAIVEHYERRSHGHYNGNGVVVEDAQEDEEDDEDDDEESEESEDEDIILPPPAIISSDKASMLSDSRYENYDYPASITKPLPSYVMAGQEPHQPSAVANGSGVLTYRNLPLPRYHLDTTTGSSGTAEATAIQMLNGVTAATTVVDIHQANQPDHPANNLLGVIIDPVLYARHFAGHNHHDLRVYHDDQDRHNDSGYSTRPGESSQGPSPSLSGPAESTEGDNTATLSPRSTRRMENFQSHFARDLAQTLPAMTNGSSTNGYYHHQNGKNGVVAYPRVRFAVPDHEQSHFPPGTISSSSLV
ncbi:ankycorbin-like isoform X2 [Daphnia carinata]|uniref:ankycorbin-like isoform X2 n=1 Tax=Daphnia carinata TaxID=120202 RepID=UPI00257A3494|nr:ankycorbin-like isoform X2 [Daphnia carinata]